MDSSASAAERRHLTWRDLPAIPPVGPIYSYDATAATVPAYPVAPPPAARPAVKRRTLAIGGAAAALIGVLAIALVANPLAASSTQTATGHAPAASAAPNASAPAGNGSTGGNGSNGGGSNQGGTNQ